MWGAIAGDVIGSVYEGHPGLPEDFELVHPHAQPTDDSVLTLAIADALLTGTDYATALRTWGRRYPRAGYGGGFHAWLQADDAGPYQSFGNGSAMRVSPVARAFDSLERILAEAEASAAPTHDHPEGVKGAQSVAAAIFVVRTGGSLSDLRTVFEQRFGYDCSTTYAELRARHTFDVTCMGTVPVAATCALLSTSVEDAIRKAVSLGGDADTLGCITGSIAEAMYGGVPRTLRELVSARLPDELRLVAERFTARFGVPMA